MNRDSTGLCVPISTLYDTQTHSSTYSHSLSSTFLKNRIIGSLSASSQEEIREAATRISQNIIFSYSTLRRLARHLVRLLAGEHTSASDFQDAKAEIEGMITKYSVGLTEDQDQDSESAKKLDGHHETLRRDHVVLLTGSTGGLGSYLLASLLARVDVATVYALNRPSKTGIQERQRAAFHDRGLDPALLDSSEKLRYVKGDAAQPNLSLDDGTYAEIHDSVTIIIHNAWRLDFNLALSSFESNVRGTRHLIDVARASKRKNKPRFLFTSSISSAQAWDKSMGTFLETVQLDARVAVGNGYGASKYVSERVRPSLTLAVTNPTILTFTHRSWPRAGCQRPRSGSGRSRVVSRGARGRRQTGFR